MTIGVTELGYIGLGVKDLDAWRAFASEVIGLEATAGNDGASFALRLDYWTQRILVTQDGSDDLAFVGWRMADQDAFEMFQEQLKQQDVPYELASSDEVADRQVLGLIKLADPSGLRTEIFYGPPCRAGNSVPSGTSHAWPFRYGR